MASGSENWSSSSGSPASSLKENFEPDAEMVTGIPKESEQPIKKLTVIARHRRLGEESLSKLKEEVRKYALDHTFKETAKKFGIHHSTVSGWVKAREKVASRHTLALMKHKAFSGKFDRHCSLFSDNNFCPESPKKILTNFGVPIRFEILFGHTVHQFDEKLSFRTRCLF